MASRHRSKDGFTLIELMIVVAIVGVLAVLAVYSVQKYIANAKTAEAKNAVGEISRDALTRYEGETMNGSMIAAGSTTGVLRDVCLSASAKVPSFVPKAKKYQSATADWNVDGRASPVRGFACLHFEMSQPQYYSYNYTGVSLTSFTASAEGDLNGDGITSMFHQDGAIASGHLSVAPAITEVTPDERASACFGCRAPRIRVLLNAREVLSSTA